MINVTSNARRELKRILFTNVDMPQARLRLLSRDKDILGIGIDVETPYDELVECDGITVLVVDRVLATNLNGLTLDLDDTPQGPELVIF